MNYFQISVALAWVAHVAAEFDTLPNGNAIRSLVSQLREEHLVKHHAFNEKRQALKAVQKVNREAARDIAKDVRKEVLGKVRKRLFQRRVPSSSDSHLTVSGQVPAEVVPNVPRVEMMWRNSILITAGILAVLSISSLMIMRHQKMAAKAVKQADLKPKSKPREDVLLGVTIAACSLCVAMWTPVFAGAYLAYQGWKIPMVLLGFPILGECINQIVLFWRQANKKLCAQDYFFNLKTVREDDVGKCLQLLGKTISYYDSHEQALAMQAHVKHVIQEKVNNEKEGLMNCYVDGDGYYFEQDKEKAMRDSYMDYNITFAESNNTAKAVEFFVTVEGNKMIAQTRARHDSIDGILAFGAVGQFCKLNQPPPEMPLAMMIVLRLLDKCPLMWYIAPPVSYSHRDTTSVAAWPKEHKSLNLAIHRAPVKAACGPFGCSDAIYTYAAICYAYIQTNKVDLDIGFIWFLKVTDGVKNNGTGVSLHIKKESTKHEIVEQLTAMKKDPLKHLQASSSGFLSNRTHLFGKGCPNMPFPKIDILFSSIPFTNTRNEDTDAWQEINIDLKLRRPMIAYLLGVQDRFLCSFVHDPARVDTEAFTKNLQEEVPVSFAPYSKDGYGAKEV